MNLRISSGGGDLEPREGGLEPALGHPGVGRHAAGEGDDLLLHDGGQARPQEGDENPHPEEQKRDRHRPRNALPLQELDDGVEQVGQDERRDEGPEGGPCAHENPHARKQDEDEPDALPGEEGALPGLVHRLSAHLSAAGLEGRFSSAAGAPRWLFIRPPPKKM